MKSAFLCSMAVCLCISTVATADTFGTGANQFEIEFVMISGATNPTSGYGIVNNDYRMGTYEITNDQWNKFVNIHDAPTGSNGYQYPGDAYDGNPYWTGTNLATSEVSWLEAAQFVNWLNTSNGYQAAYNFTGTQGTSDYTFALWDAADAWDGTNLYRHKDAYYFLPTENEWVKAAYWNGTSLQTYATKPGDTVYLGNGTNGGWNYGGYAVRQPWEVGSGSEELNGTFDMMGNLWEWNETEIGVNYPYRIYRGGSYYNIDAIRHIRSSYRRYSNPCYESTDIGFRVASVPEPTTLALLTLGGLVIKKRK